MAKPSDLTAELAEAAQRAREQENAEGRRTRRNAQYHAERRVEATSLRLAGLSFEQIGDRLGISENAAREMVGRSFNRAETGNVEEMRQLENTRLDRAQAAIWSKVLQGDEKAVRTYLSISKQRAAINGLNAPTNINLSIGVRHEMDAALSDLEQLVAEAEVVVDAEVVDETPADDGAATATDETHTTQSAQGVDEAVDKYENGTDDEDVVKMLETVEAELIDDDETTTGTDQ